jgi:hypothetical protein
MKYLKCPKTRDWARIIALSLVSVGVMDSTLATAAVSSFQHMNLFTVTRQAEGYFVRIWAHGMELDHHFSNEDFQQMKTGNWHSTSFESSLTQCEDLLVARNDRRALVLHLEDTQDRASAAAATEFAYALQKCYPSRRIYRDPLSSSTDDRVGKLHAFKAKRPEDLAAIIAPESFLNQTSVRNIEDALTNLRVQVIEYSSNTPTPIWTGGTNKGIIVITGHSSPGLARFVETIGTAGYFRDNFVVFNSCGTALTEEMISRINSDHGAIATLGFQGTIEAAKVNLFLLDAIQKTFEEKDHPRSFADVVAQSALKMGLNGLWTLCYCMPTQCPQADPPQSYAEANLNSIRRDPLGKRLAKPNPTAEIPPNS